MVSLTAHTAAHRKLRRMAREHGCIVVCAPNSGRGGQDAYVLHDQVTGVERGRLHAAHRGLDKVDVDEVFEGLA
jgi:hypothetical protein